MLRRLVILCAAVGAACAAGPPADARPPSSHAPARAAVPTTRLVVGGERRLGDLDCRDLRDRADAEAVLRADPRDPHGLDADADGIACEKLR